ncbi:MAG: single-stranded-DNA-specific exonuclease RecJ [Candidatus Dojkabacteria bacterium]|uniref:Single-stranded-DNA-specific exonuclease RecJ n=2 Tax=Candidatus Dojkabacteria TaxID=74243 RepID=A0A136KJR6_9BACT|nr:MAG: Single-stranded-DNA-specific exonuclease RecJ [candidate division WS6 bacterium OLB21]MBW7954054.1 single-stranded-DNA-specific exonuclease RecJ [Candidatus Dojkabacteria bacterium]WKZ27794.1 MAG: single-stranded-DNA-specific exonuclease RecJ [Candidatus Dojkabacteria bacterium]
MVWNLLTQVPDEISIQLKEYEPIVRQLLYNRKITDLETAENFFSPSLDQLLSPFNLPDIQKAVNTILYAIKSKQKIFVYGDYDVDGVCATTIVFDFLYRRLQADVVPYIPDRFVEGYGLSKAGLDTIIRQKGQLIITVDCGIRDIELVSKYSKKGLDFIISDHHELPEVKGKITFPEKALAVVHPKRPDSDYKFKEISGAGVAYKLMCALEETAYEQKLLHEKRATTDYLDLVALSTVCDVMPLVSENRTLVSSGIDKIRENPNKGIAALLNIAQVQRNEISTYHLGYILGPRINAGGRISKAIDGVRLMSSHNQNTISKVAEELDLLNKERQKQTLETMQSAEKFIEGKIPKLIFIAQPDWSEGIVGLVAGKLSQSYYRPTLVATILEDKVKGSARSVPGFNITEAIANSANKLTRFGGHEQAAGFSLKRDNLEDFMNEITEYVNTNLSETDLVQTLRIDAELNLSEINFDLIDSINRFEPFGHGNNTPLFCVRNIPIKNVFTLGKNLEHVKIVTHNANGLELIGFGMSDRYEELKHCVKIDAVGHLSTNTWRDKKTIQLVIKDFINV